MERVQFMPTSGPMPLKNGWTRMCSELCTLFLFFLPSCSLFYFAIIPMRHGPYKDFCNIYVPQAELGLVVISDHPSSFPVKYNKSILHTRFSSTLVYRLFPKRFFAVLGGGFELLPWNSFWFRLCMSMQYAGSSTHFGPLSIWSSQIWPWVLLQDEHALVTASILWWAIEGSQ